MKAAEDHLRASRPIPIRKLKGPPGKRQMYGDADHLRHWPMRRTTVQQIFVPIVGAPVLGGGRGKAGQGECGSEDVLAEASIGVLRIEGIDQERVVGLHW